MHVCIGNRQKNEHDRLYMPLQFRPAQVKMPQQLLKKRPRLVMLSKSRYLYSAVTFINHNIISFPLAISRQNSLTTLNIGNGHLIHNVEPSPGQYNETVSGSSTPAFFYTPTHISPRPEFQFHKKITGVALLYKAAGSNGYIGAQSDQ